MHKQDMDIFFIHIKLQTIFSAFYVIICHTDGKRTRHFDNCQFTQYCELL